MNRDLIKEDLIQLDWEVTDRDDYFQKMVCKLEDLGYVRASFKKAILEREEKYPTALPTQPEAIAIPHSDIEHVIKPFIAATRLASPCIGMKWVITMPFIPCAISSCLVSPRTTATSRSCSCF